MVVCGASFRYLCGGNLRSTYDPKRGLNEQQISNEKRMKALSSIYNRYSAFIRVARRANTAKRI